MAKSGEGPCYHRNDPLLAAVARAEIKGATPWSRGRHLTLAFKRRV